jgi:hypothetical protein
MDAIQQLIDALDSAKTFQSTANSLKKLGCQVSVICCHPRYIPAFKNYNVIKRLKKQYDQTCTVRIMKNP